MKFRPSSGEISSHFNMNTKLGIIIPTMNRPDFIIRQLRYYAQVKCPCTIYIGDSSDKEASKKIQKEIEKLKNIISVKYLQYPKMGGVPCIRELIKNVQEKFIAFVGDDDFLVPDTLTKCVEFLESHSDYATAHGYAVTFKTENDAVFGKITKIKDYKRSEACDDTAVQRVSRILEDYYVTLFSVHYTDKLLKNWEISKNIFDSHFSFSSEITPGCLDVIDGKSKLIESLGLVRQMHDMRLVLQTTFNLITHDSWQPEYKIFIDLVSKAAADRDRIPLEKAKKAIKLSYWYYLQYWLAKDYAMETSNFSCQKTKKISLKRLIAEKIPQLKKPYKIIKRLITKKRWIHDEVMRPKSFFYNDFQKITQIIQNEKNENS